MSKDRDKKVTRAREAKLEADLAQALKELAAEREYSALMRDMASEFQDRFDVAQKRLNLYEPPAHDDGASVEVDA